MGEKQFWQSYQPVRIVAGEGALIKLPELVQGPQLLLITSAGFRRRGVVAELEALLSDYSLQVIDSITPNPELDELDAIIQRLSKGPEVTQVIALGGGSVLDAAKVLAAVLPLKVSSPLNHYFRNNESLDWSKPIALTTIPTTAGTGAEVTPFATVWDNTTKSKYSLSGDFMFPNTALLDPKLILSLPKHETLQTGLDAVSHALESIWNVNRTPVSSAYALQAASMLLEALPQALRDPSDLSARAATQQASLLAGLAISQTRTAIAHSMSYPLTSYYEVPHGLACSFTLPAIIEVVLQQNVLADHESRLLRQMHEMLLELPLFSLLSQHVSWQDIDKVKDSMSHVQRAGNFLLPVSAELIAAILARSRELAESAANA